MASQRRTKNFATDPQTPMFLYTILKQLDLRSINWNDVAAGLDISNGHAARMRYSRMKSQFEGLSNQAKPPKAKKETTGDNKSSKSKAKNNKRLLMEDENARLASQQQNSSLTMPQNHDPKRIKLEPQLSMVPWGSHGMQSGYASQSAANMYWTHPMSRSEPLNFSMQGLPAQSRAMQIPHTEADMTESTHNPATTSIPATKQEPVSFMDDTAMAESDIVNVKQEPGTVQTGRASLAMPSGTRACSTYPLSRTVNAYFDRQQNAYTASQVQFPSAVMPGYTNNTSTPSSNMYPSTDLYTSSQSGSDWTDGGFNQTRTAAVNEDSATGMMLNPKANTYQDMLSMPLYRRSPSVLQIPNPYAGQISQRPPLTQTQAEQGCCFTGDPEISAAVLAGQASSSPSTTTKAARGTSASHAENGFIEIGETSHKDSAEIILPINSSTVEAIHKAAKDVRPLADDNNVVKSIEIKTEVIEL